ncbi:Uncharacterized protein AB751O23_AJ_00080 [Chlamydiales bacterium SCGC AB-751-O23]|jgi:cytochrome c-type biogenesis protein|nr:Uncharacterized protein AB751O23_AJ_00080 [Chlamydiales bacterium SCGC AB-751-O23]
MINSFFISAFLAGVFTAFSPCVLPILPSILGKKIWDGKKKLSFVFLGIFSSISLLTLLLISPKALWGFNPSHAKTLASIVLFCLGVFMFFPSLWEKFQEKMKVFHLQGVLQRKTGKSPEVSDFLTGLALGFTFSSCSPTYLSIVGILIPQDLSSGLFYYAIFFLGFLSTLWFFLFLSLKGIRLSQVSLYYQTRVKKGLALLIIFLAISIFFSLDKALIGFLLKNNLFPFWLEF